MIKRKNRLKNKELSYMDIIVRSLKFTVLFCLMGILLSFATSLILYRTEDPCAFLEITGISLLFFTVSVTSFIQSKVNKQRYFFASLLLGIFIFILTFLISIITSKYEFNTVNFIWRLLIPVFSVLGGALGVNKENKKRKRNR